MVSLLLVKDDEAVKELDVVVVDVSVVTDGPEQFANDAGEVVVGAVEPDKGVTARGSVVLEDFVFDLEESEGVIEVLVFVRFVDDLVVDVDVDVCWVIYVDVGHGIAPVCYRDSRRSSRHPYRLAPVSAGTRSCWYPQIKD